MSLGAGPSPLSGASSSSVHRQTVAESGKKEPKLNFTADENQALTAYTPAMSVGPNGENNLEKARLFRKVPPRSPYDRTYSCHNYMNTTCGAFVAHSLGFKQAGGGGMMKLLGRMYEQLGKHAGDVASIRTRMEAEEGVATPSSPNPASQSTSANNSGSAGSKDAHNVRLVHALLESGQKVLSQQWENQQRQHTIVSQAMTALTTSFVAQLLTNLHQIDVWRRIVKIGYLQQVESLLSTFHSEQYMLQDFCYAVRALEHVKVTIVQQTEAREVEEDAFGHYLDPVKLNETLKAAAAAATSAAAVGGSGAASLTVPPPPPNVPPNVPAPDRSRSPSPPPPPPPSGGEAVAASVSVSAASSVEPASPAPGAGFAPPNNTPANSAGIPPQIRTSSAPAAIVSPEGEADALPLMNRVHSLEEEDVPPPPMEPHPAASASVAPAPTAVSVTAASSTTPASNNSLAPPLPPRKRTVSQGQRPANLAPPLVSPASPSQPPASPSASSGVSSPGATLSPPPAISPAAIRSVSPTTRKVNTMTMPSPNFISNRIARPQAKTMHQPIQRSPAAVAAAALGSEEDFVSAEDNIPQVAAGMAPTVHQRVQEINTVHISLLVPPTAAPIASLPFATEAPGSTMPGASKKTKWFSMSSSGSNGTENSAAAQAAAEAAAKAAGAMPFTTTPSLPHPYSASSVVIVIELPPHLYRLLPVCLRELEPKSAPAAASSQASNNSLNVPPSTLSGANSPVTPSLNGNDSHKVMEEIAPIGSVPGVTSGTFSTPVGSSLLNSSSSFDDSTAPLNKASVTTTPVPPTAAPVLTSSDQEAPQLSTPLIDIWPVLITQGVNELQTMANKMGRNELQQEINLYSLEILKAYFIMFAKYQKAHLDVISASSKERLKNGSMLQMIGKDLQACELMIQSFNAEKNIQLLVLCADIVKRMSGGRIVCCKSAKDRTSMAVTWDQARLLYEQHGLSEHDVQSALNLMRTEGVRKLNVVKNTGQSAYAFNMLQRSLLPAIFRPPEHSCSSSIEG